MKTLQTIQKTFHVFQILAKIAMIFCIVGASICAVGALCAVTWYNGGHVFSIFGSELKMFSDSANLMQTYAYMLTETILLTANAVLFGFAVSYLKTEQAEGTPFTEKGAEMLKKLGIRCIYIPIVAAVLASVVSALMNAREVTDFSDLPGVATGIVLILASLIFRYGAQLEQSAHAVISDAEQ